ncbi:hypothetical protein QM012_009274 [Aureobasidium pullulans]|uniref:Uncharacterized protein n=1 Tax=Aureobasidium pullulans TaxID=5580 RepID=A0ABR0TGD6_AURPU
MDSRELLDQRAAIVSDIVKELQDVVVSEAPAEDDTTEPEILIDRVSSTSGRSQSLSDSDTSEQTREERDWINNTPKWSPPAELALYSTSPSLEWKRACATLNTVVSKAEMMNVPVTSVTFDPSLFTSLVIKPKKKELRKLKHAIQQPVQPPYLGEVSFDCSAIRTKEDVNNLGKCRESLVEILQLLYEQGRTSHPVHPIRDALILLLEAFLCAIETKQETWCSWNGDDPNVSERSNEMEASCCLTYTGIGPFERELPRFQVWFDYGLQIGSLTVSDAGEKTVQETWLCIFEDEFEFGHMLVNGWPGISRPYLDYNLVAFETLLMTTTELRRIDIRNTKVHLGGLLSLLNRNRRTLDILLDLMGYIGDRLVLDYLRIKGCKHHNCVLKELDIEIGYADGIILDIFERRKRSIRIANVVLARFLALEPPEEIPRLSIAKAPLCLW